MWPAALQGPAGQQSDGHAAGGVERFEVHDATVSANALYSLQILACRGALVGTVSITVHTHCWRWL
jgi:hypothetical protein